MRATGRAIGRYGPARLTLAAVAAEAGVAPATLVQRFGSKRALLLAFARQTADAVPGIFAQARQTPGGPLVALCTALAELAASVRTPAELANNLGFLQMDLSDPEFREPALAQVTQVRTEITRLLADAVAAGELVPGVDTVQLARAVQVTYNGVLILWALAPDGSLVDALRTDLDHLLQPYRPLRKLAQT